MRVPRHGHDNAYREIDLEEVVVETCEGAPGDLVLLVQVPEHRPWATLRWLRDQRAKRRLPIYRRGARVLVSLEDVDRLVSFEPAMRGPLAREVACRG